MTRPKSAARTRSSPSRARALRRRRRRQKTSPSPRSQGGMSTFGLGRRTPRETHRATSPRAATCCSDSPRASFRAARRARRSDRPARRAERRRPRWPGAPPRGTTPPSPQCPASTIPPLGRGRGRARTRRPTCTAPRCANPREPSCETGGQSPAPAAQRSAPAATTRARIASKPRGALPGNFKLCQLPRRGSGINCQSQTVKSQKTPVCLPVRIFANFAIFGVGPKQTGRRRDCQRGQGGCREVVGRLLGSKEVLQVEVVWCRRFGCHRERRVLRG